MIVTVIVTETETEPAAEEAQVLFHDIQLQSSRPHQAQRRTLQQFLQKQKQKQKQKGLSMRLAKV